jgi:hypothetical protein
MVPANNVINNFFLTLLSFLTQRLFIFLLSQLMASPLSHLLVALFLAFFSFSLGLTLTLNTYVRDLRALSASPADSRIFN